MGWVLGWNRMRWDVGLGQDRIGVLDGMEWEETLFTFIPAAPQG